MLHLIEAFFGLHSFLAYYDTVFVSRSPFDGKSFVYEKISIKSQHL